MNSFMLVFQLQLPNGTWTDTLAFPHSHEGTLANLAAVIESGYRPQNIHRDVGFIHDADKPDNEKENSPARRLSASRVSESSLKSQFNQ